jgi:hypothetical protein
LRFPQQRCSRRNTIRAPLGSEVLRVRRPAPALFGRLLSIQSRKASVVEIASDPGTAMLDGEGRKPSIGDPGTLSCRSRCIIAWISTDAARRAGRSRNAAGSVDYCNSRGLRRSARVA